ncbi:MAG TPA: hypothetical protein VHP14_09715, partial [Anaerolineales bacterium]|nr:hypothetical protein [Anaerolineales bacterium]
DLFVRFPVPIGDDEKYEDWDYKEAQKETEVSHIFTAKGTKELRFHKKFLRVPPRHLRPGQV